MLLVRLSHSSIEKGQVDRIGSDKVASVLVIAYLNLEKRLTATTGSREEGVSKDLVNSACTGKHLL